MSFQKSNEIQEKQYDNDMHIDSDSSEEVDKGGMVAKVVLTTLAQMNEKLSVLEKTIAKPVAEVSEDEDDDLAFLPVKSIGDFEKFERNLKQNKDVFRKLVSMITRLGKRNTKNSQGDYVRRSWGCVIANSVDKELNWLGRPDKRVNNGLGKRGIKESLITKAIQRGISSNKDFREIEISAFECETKTFLKNSKATYDRKANAPGKDGEDSEDTTENY
ncbi:hypothetical protein GHT06_013451 [Daphnia sinensis]|uniref:DUF4806 domain-containing protein n=1 Tax=Daphnia sinensis TaxID=1820382 RepID=A0AAD5KSA5_9CRUS|nr:hypothetical protein GHT06_013451 [Daphnia sinensis]